MKYTALYLRVSTQEQAAEGYSIDEQAERLKNYCKAMGWLDNKLYIDAGCSGGDVNRPALQNLIQDIKSGQIEKVVVYKLDRLSRSQKDTLNLIEDIFLKNNVDFISINENFDTSTPFGRAMIGILAVFAQLEREQIKERITMGREGRAKDGKYHGGKYSPVGYDYIDGELVVNEFEKLQIDEIYKRFLSGQTISTILKEFDEKGYFHKYGKWNYKKIRSVLSNPVYIGKITFDGQTYDGTHPPIVDAELFTEAKNLLDARTEANADKKITNHSRTTYFGGFIYCKQCGARYGVANQTYKAEDGQIKGHKYYSCYSRNKRNRAMVIDPKCKNKTYRVDRFDKIIFDEIKKLELEPEYISEIKKQNSTSDQQNKADILKAEIENINSQRLRIMDLFSIGQFSINEIQDKIDTLNSKREKLQAEIERIAAADSRMQVPEVQQTARTLSDALEKGSFEQVRMLIEALIEKIEIDGDNISIYWRFA